MEKMKLEIERKFLVQDDWPRPDSGMHCIQGYISADEQRVVRVRIMDNKARLTIKALKTKLTRIEYEYEIPVDDAKILLENLCIKPLIEKIRFTICSFGQKWEIDKFLGENSGLVVAEIELEQEDQPIELPEWLGEEVSHDSKYYNANLAVNPFMKWMKVI